METESSYFWPRSMNLYSLNRYLNLGQRKSDISYIYTVCIRCIHVCSCVCDCCDSLIIALQGLKYAGVLIIQTTGKFL